MKLANLLSILLIGCGNSQIVNPPIDDIAEKVCYHLTELGCEEGRNSNCSYYIRVVQGMNEFLIDTDCLLQAKNRDEARECGSVECQ